MGHLLSKVVRHIAHYPIRTRGTMCGSLANADPASEWCLVAATLEAELTAISSRGTRSIRASDWFRGLMTTALRPDELLLQVRFQALPSDSGLRLPGVQPTRRRFRLGDGAGDVPCASRCDRRATCGHRCGRGRRLAASRRAEEILRGAKPSRELYEQAAKVAAESVDPLTDARYDAAYRRDLTRTMTLRALNEALAHVNVDLTVNGERHVVDVEPRCTLADALREKCGKTGTNIGCEHGVCGACTVLVDGEPVRSCLLFAVQLTGKVDPNRGRAREGRSAA